MAGSGVGRGRGRGRGAMIYKELKSPGPGNSNSEESWSKMTKMLNSLATDTTTKEIQTVADQIKICCTSKEKTEKVVQELIAKCQNNWRFSSCAAEISSELDTFKTDDGNLYRNVLLSALHANFKEKEKLRGQSPERFLSCLSLMCQVFGKLRLDGDPFLVLVNPSMESLELMLDNKASDEEMICAVTQMQAIGKLLQEHADSMRLNKMKNMIRDKITDSCGSREVRLKLIEVLEGFASNWTVK